MTNSQIRESLIEILSTLSPEYKNQRQQLLELFKQVKTPEKQIIKIAATEEVRLLEEEVRRLCNDYDVLKLKLTSLQLKLEEKEKSKEEAFLEEEKNHARHALMGILVPFNMTVINHVKLPDKVIDQLILDSLSSWFDVWEPVLQRPS